ncbi:MAG: hypothetical protein RL346_761 [Verrucomicrobiota bacterium]|jgi:hypothetical protein
MRGRFAAKQRIFKPTNLGLHRPRFFISTPWVWVVVAMERGLKQEAVA